MTIPLVLAPLAREAITSEVQRRTDLRRAIAESVKGETEGDDVVTLSALRRHLALYYGKALAEGATVADLAGTLATLGGVLTSAGFVGIALRRPSREAMKRTAAKWNAGLPKGEAPLIRRLRHDIEGSNNVGKGIVSEEPLKEGFLDIASATPGTVYRANSGVYRQVPPQSAAMVNRSGGDGKRGSVARRRRFPSYIESIRMFLEVNSAVSAVDRQILEHVTEGQTLQWIADELGMKKCTVHKRVAKIRKVAGIAGPGSGR